MIPLGCLASATVPASDFSPSDLADLILWLKADSLALSDGAEVTTWTDSGPAGNHATQSVGDRKPLYRATGGPGSSPAVEWMNADDRLESAASASGAEQTIFAVIKRDAAGGTIVGGSGGDGALHFKFGPKLGLNKEWVEEIASDAASPDVPLDWCVVAATYSQAGDVGTCRLNGVTVVTKTYTGALSSGRTTRVGMTNGQSETFDGKMVELIRYGRLLDSTDIASVEAYLADKYGL